MGSAPRSIKRWLLITLIRNEIRKNGGEGPRSLSTITGNAIATWDVCEQPHEEGTQRPVQDFTSYHLIALGKDWEDASVAKMLP